MSTEDRQAEQDQSVAAADVSSERQPLTERIQVAATRLLSTPSGFWWRAAFAGGLAIIFGVGLLYGLRALGRPIAVTILALTLASAVGPLVDLVDRVMPRVLAIAIIYLAFPGILALIGYIIAPSFVSQFESVTARIPELINTLQPLIQRLGTLAPSNLGSTIASQLSSFAASLVSVPLAIANSIVDIVAVIFISIYALLEAENARNFFLSLVPEERRGNMGNLLHHVIWEMGGYLRGAFLDGLIIGLTIYLGLVVIGVDFPIVLGLIAGILELIPTLGPIIAAVPILLVALVQSPTKALITLIFMLAVHQFEGNIVFPNVMRSQTSISSLLVLVGLLSGYAAGGILGALTAIPVVAVARVVVIDVIAPAIRRETGAPKPEEEKKKKGDGKTKSAIKKVEEKLDMGPSPEEEKGQGEESEEKEEQESEAGDGEENRAEPEDG